MITEHIKKEALALNSQGYNVEKIFDCIREIDREVRQSVNSGAMES